MDDLVVNAVFGLRDMLSAGLGRIQNMLGATAAQAAGLSARMGALALAMAPVALAAAALAFAFGSCTSSAMAFESAMADVGKVVNFETRSDFDAMGESILTMSGRIPMAADGIAAIVASAAQSGIAKNELMDFAEQAAKMGVAFDLTGDIAGKMMADWRAGMGLTLPRVYALADATNHLSNNMNAQAPALGEVIQRVGALAMSCGLGEVQVAALGAAFLSAGAGPEIASTALKKFTSTLVKGAAMSKKQAGAFAELGFSSVQLAKDMQTNAQGTIFSVLEALAAKPKELQMSLLTVMFGEEAIGAIAPLLANMGNLTQAFELIGDASSYAGSMQAEFETRSKTAENAVRLLANRFTALGVTIGNVFLPIVSAVAPVLGDFVDGLRGIFASPMGQWFLRVAASLATGVLGVTAFAGDEISGASSDWERFGLIVGSIGGWSLKALATALEVVVNGLSILVDMVCGVSALLTGDFATASAYGERILGSMGESILALADLFCFGDWLRESWREAVDFLGGIDLFASGGKIIDTLINGIKAKAGALVDSVSGAFASVREYLPFSDAKRGPLSDLTASGAAIMGTLGLGVDSGAASFVNSISAAFDEAASFLGLDGSLDMVAGGFAPQPALAPAPAYDMPPPATTEGRGLAARSGQGGGRTFIIQKLEAVLPGVKDGAGFVDELKKFLEQFDG